MANGTAVVRLSAGQHAHTDAGGEFWEVIPEAETTSVERVLAFRWSDDEWDKDETQPSEQWQLLMAMLPVAEATEMFEHNWPDEFELELILAERIDELVRWRERHAEVTAALQLLDQRLADIQAEIERRP